MYEDNRANRIINRIYSRLVVANDIAYEARRHNIRALCKHLRRYWMVYWFILTKICAIAMIGIGIHCMESHFNGMLPFGIASESEGLWFIWGYAGGCIGGCMTLYGFFKLFEFTIREWVRSL